MSDRPLFRIVVNTVASGTAIYGLCLQFSDTGEVHPVSLYLADPMRTRAEIASQLCRLAKECWGGFASVGMECPDSFVVLGLFDRPFRIVETACQLTVEDIGRLTR